MYFPHGSRICHLFPTDETSTELDLKYFKIFPIHQDNYQLGYTIFTKLGLKLLEQMTKFE